MKKPVKVAGINKKDMKPQKSLNGIFIKYGYIKLIGSNRSFGIVFFIVFY